MAEHDGVMRGLIKPYSGRKDKSNVNSRKSLANYGDNNDIRQILRSEAVSNKRSSQDDMAVVTLKGDYSSNRLGDAPKDIRLGS